MAAEAERDSDYPTYGRDPNAPKRDAKPTDVELPLRRRTHAWPIAIAVIGVLLIGVALFAWSAVEMAGPESDAAQSTTTTEEGG